MRKNAVLWMMILCLLICGSAFADAAYIDGKTASRVHLRNAPSKDSESMGLFYTGTEIMLDNASLEDEWVRVAIGAMHGYVMNDYLTKERPVSMLPACRVKGGSLNLRAEPSRQAKVLKVLEDAERLAIMGQTSNDWYYVLHADGTIGYVMPQYVTLTGESISTSNAEIRKVGETFDGYIIYSWLAPNGQTLYFSGLEDPTVKFEDVNFDGHEDVVFTIIRGASNFFAEFFVWSDGQYVRAANNGMDYALCNYHLYPEYGVVHSDANNGYAGALHEDILLRWEGTDLKVIRRAVSDHYTETADLAAREGYATTTYQQKLRVRVWDYTSNIYEGEKVYETVIDLDALNGDDDYERLFAGEQKALWNGIK